jgi:hypothetical protein
MIDLLPVIRVLEVLRQVSVDNGVEFYTSSTPAETAANIDQNEVVKSTNW